MTVFRRGCGSRHPWRGERIGGKAIRDAIRSIATTGATDLTIGKTAAFAAASAIAILGACGAALANNGGGEAAGGEAGSEYGVIRDAGMLRARSAVGASPNEPERRPRFRLEAGDCSREYRLQSTGRIVLVRDCPTTDAR